MLTRCPKCNTWFRIHPEHLQAASGYVQCGRCFTRFNALLTLAEEAKDDSGDEAPSAVKPTEPAPPVEAAAPASAAPAPPQEPAQQRPSQEPGPEVAPAAADWLAGNEDSDSDTTQAPLPETASAADREGEVKEPGVRWTAVDIDDDWRMDKLLGDADVATKEPPPEKREDSTIGPPPLVEVDLPLTLRSQSGRKSGRQRRRRTVLWGIGVFLLLIVFAAQYAYFHREQLLADYPVARPLVTRWCKKLGCTLPVRRDLSAIHVVNRDVREHPNFAGTLLVNATIVNDAAFTQPYPTLQLSLYDTNGALLGLRRFKPAEYLDDSIDIGKGMPPHKPVHVVLEVAGASDAAVSFEFRFL